MPSHKHKKKKKSHKKYKKQMVSSSDDEDFWKVSLSDSDSDRSQNGKILTSLVRRSYMNHIEQVLIENINKGKHTGEPCDKSVQELASKLSTIFDQKALKASMMSELYRKNMVSSIKAVQEKTSVGRIYVDEKIFSKLNMTLSKETQTEDFKKRCEVEIQTDCPQPTKRACVAETQTELPLLSMLELPLPKTLTLSPCSRPYDPAINFSDSVPSSPGVSSSQQLVTTTSVKPDACCITSTSDLLSPVLNKTLPTETLAVEILQNATSTTCDSNEKMNVPCPKVIDTSNRNSSQDNCNNEHVKIDLNTRLTAMGLLNDGNEEDSWKSKKSNWYAEEIAQSCNFTRILMKMTTKQRKRILLKIKELFGDDSESLAELSEENIRTCRKRIASIVVMELTPIYQAKRIASRYLFKYVAKQITNTLMDQSYAPDSRSIRQRVKHFFSNGHVVMSEADCCLR